MRHGVMLAVKRVHQFSDGFNLCPGCLVSYVQNAL